MEIPPANPGLTAPDVLAGLGILAELGALTGLGTLAGLGTLTESGALAELGTLAGLGALAELGAPAGLAALSTFSVPVLSGLLAIYPLDSEVDAIFIRQISTNKRLLLASRKRNS